MAILITAAGSSRIVEPDLPNAMHSRANLEKALEFKTMVIPMGDTLMVVHEKEGLSKKLRESSTCYVNPILTGIYRKYNPGSIFHILGPGILIDYTKLKQEET